MAPKTILAVILSAGVAAAGAVLWLRTEHAETPAQAPARQPDTSTSKTEPSLSPVTSERVDPGTVAANAETSSEKDAAATGERHDVSPVRRKVTESEKEAVRSLVKLSPPEQTYDLTISDSVTPTNIPGTDDDSFLVKYGSFNEAGLRDSLESLQAILEWQDQGPFEDKATELMPPQMRRAFELEIEWLERKIAEG
jgi:hypothetical protein